MATAAQLPELVGYDDDFALWLEQQAQAVESGRWAEVDRDNVAEELRALVRRDFREFVSARAIVIQHMLKWDHQPAFRSESWLTVIRTQRTDAEFSLEDNPGFRARTDEALTRAFPLARREAAKETGLDEKRFPGQCPYSFDEVMNRRHGQPRIRD